MTDLTDKFFKADLSQDEEEALDALLASSPEAAGRFADKAAEAYARFGLPEAGASSGPGPMPGWRFRLGTLAFALALVAGLGWWRHGPGKAAWNFQGNQPPAAGSPSVRLSAGVSPAGKTESSKAPDSNEKPGDFQHANGEKPLLEAPSRTSGIPSVPGSKTYSQLKISVEIRQEGPVTVEILGADGATVKNLFNGALPAGKYDFTWDGKLEDGRPASPGNYRLETRSGPTVQTQEFSIEKKGKNTE